MVAAGAVWVDVLPSLNRFGTALRRETSTSASTAGTAAGKYFGTKFSGSAIGPMRKLAAAAGGAFAAAKIGGFLKDSITQASDLNETVSKVGQIFGPAAADIQKYAETAATSLGQTKQQALDANATFGIFGKSAGLSGKALSGFTEQLTGLATDMASFNNTSPEQAIEAIGSALRGESEPIRAYGVLLDDASLRQQALRDGLIKTTKTALTPQQRVLAAQKLILKQTGDQQGDFARTSGGLANQQRILAAEFANAKTAIGSVFLPIAVKAVSSLTPLLNKAADFGRQLQSGFSFRQFTGEEAPELIGKVEKIGYTIGRMVETSLPVLRSFGDFFRRNADLIVAFAAGFVAFKAATVAASAVSALSGALKVLRGAVVSTEAAIALLGGPVTIIAVAIAALGAAAVLAYKRSDTFREKVNQLAGIVAAKAKPILDALAKTFREQVLPALQRAGDYITTKIMPAVLAFAERIGKNLLPIAQALGKLLVERVIPGVQGLIGAVIKAAPPVLKVAGVIAVVVGKFLEFTTKVAGIVIPLILKLAGPILGFFFKRLQFQITLLGKIAGGIVDFWTGVKNVFSAGRDYVVGKFLDLVGSVLHAAAKLGGWIPGFGEKLKQAAEDFDAFRRSVDQQKFNEKVIEIRAKLDDAAAVYVKAGVNPSYAHKLAAMAYRADGGPIRGPGSGTSDSIPAMLSNGEHVWTAREVAAAGGHAGVYALREAVRAGAFSRFARGGAVGVNSDLPTPAQLREFKTAVSRYGKAIATGLTAPVSAGVAAIGNSASFGAPSGAGAPSFNGRYAFPLPRGSYRVGVPLWGYPGHTGQDFPTPIGTRVFAPFSGMFTPVRLGNRSYGNYANIVAGNMRSIQGHLSGFARGPGLVKAGDLVAYSGSTGNSTGPHLHQEFRRDGHVINPRSVLTYDQGGIVPPGLHNIYNGTGGPEALLNHQQWNTLAQAATSPAPNVMVLIDGREIESAVVRVTDRRDLALSDGLLYRGNS